MQLINPPSTVLSIVVVCFGLTEMASNSIKHGASEKEKKHYPVAYTSSLSEGQVDISAYEHISQHIT